jgi:hypothetical protein
MNCESKKKLFGDKVLDQMAKGRRKEHQVFS